jgi:hypothetical protein
MSTSNQKILISRDVIFNENTHIDQQIDIQEDKQELIDFNQFQNPTISNNTQLLHKNNQISRLYNQFSRMYNQINRIYNQINKNHQVKLI